MGGGGLSARTLDIRALDIRALDILGPRARHPRSTSTWSTDIHALHTHAPALDIRPPAGQPRVAAALIPTLRMSRPRRGALAVLTQVPQGKGWSCTLNPGVWHPSASAYALSCVPQGG